LCWDVADRPLCDTVAWYTCQQHRLLPPRCHWRDLLVYSSMTGGGGTLYHPRAAYAFSLVHSARGRPCLQTSTGGRPYATIPLPLPSWFAPDARNYRMGAGHMAYVRSATLTAPFGSSLGAALPPPSVRDSTATQRTRRVRLVFTDRVVTWIWATCPERVSRHHLLFARLRTPQRRVPVTTFCTSPTQHIHRLYLHDVKENRFRL